jgi:hypothetical protein
MIIKGTNLKDPDMAHYRFAALEQSEVNLQPDHSDHGTSLTLVTENFLCFPGLVH